MDRSTAPRSVEIGELPAAVQKLRDLAFVPPLLHEAAEDPVDSLHLLRRPGNEDDPVGLDAFVLTTGQSGFRGACVVDELASQAEPGRAALAVTQLDEAALPGEHLCRKLAAVFPSHGTLDALDDGGDWAAIVLEAICAVLDGNAGALAKILVVGALIRILEAPPAAHVVDEDQAGVGPTLTDVVEERLQAGTSRDAKATSAMIGIGAHNLDTAGRGIVADGVRLVLR